MVSLNGGESVILVTKDINMRIKARAVGINAEDYRNDKLVSDVSQMGSGYSRYKGSIWDDFVDVKYTPGSSTRGRQVRCINL